MWAFPKFLLHVLKFLLHILCYKACYVRSCNGECGLHCVDCHVHSWHMRCLVPTPSSLCSVTMTLANTALELSTSPTSTLLRSSPPSCWSRLRRCTRLTGLSSCTITFGTRARYTSTCFVAVWYTRDTAECFVAVALRLVHRSHTTAWSMAVLLHFVRAVPKFGSQSGSCRNPVFFSEIQQKSSSGQILAGFRISAKFTKCFHNSYGIFHS